MNLYTGRKVYRGDIRGLKGTIVVPPRHLRSKRITQDDGPCSGIQRGGGRSY
jgi:hypothetical protein